MARRKSSGSSHRNEYWRGYWGFEKSVPIRAEGGIKAQSKGGTFGSSWWAKRWIGVLEGFDIGKRLARGRSYARKGQVRSIAIETGMVKAKVQGSRPTPYGVEIRVATLSAAEWGKVIAELGRQAIFTAKLLAGEMPQEIEEVFREVGLTLFPGRSKDLATECSCPDWSNPCKHIAAVYYLLGEEFDRDPFLLFQLRGLSREALLARLGTKAARGGRAEAMEEAPPPAAEPLSLEASTFWGDPSKPVEALADVVVVPSEAAALPRRLGAFPFWRGETPFLNDLRVVYPKASAVGMEVFLGLEGGAGSDATR